jgi:hypothetical protein
MLESAGKDIGPSMRWGIVPRLCKKARILTSTRAFEIEDNDVIALDSESNRLRIPAETVVLAAGLVSQRELVKPLNESGVSYFTVGSCQAPGKIAEAIHRGFEVGCEI